MPDGIHPNKDDKISMTNLLIGSLTLGLQVALFNSAVVKQPVDASISGGVSAKPWEMSVLIQKHKTAASQRCGILTNQVPTILAFELEGTIERTQSVCCQHF
jgi:hypothetical protein